jgi:hypothetical protein
MFDFPLPKRENTLYSKLKITPDSTPQQINDAINRIKSALSEKKNKLNRELDRVYKAFPQIREIEKELSDIKDQESIDHSKLNAVSKKLQIIERKALIEFPFYKSHLETVAKVDREINEINTMILDKPEEREKYDLATPPCALLKLEKMEIPLFEDTRDAQFLLRKEIASYLMEQKGISTYHPSDFTKDDFESDFRKLKSLDGV